RLRLALEALAQVLVGRQVLGQDLDGDRTLQPRVQRLVDLSHPARADRGKNLVRTEPRTCRQCHAVPSSIGVISDSEPDSGVRTRSPGFPETNLPSRVKFGGSSMPWPRS